MSISSFNFASHPSETVTVSRPEQEPVRAIISSLYRHLAHPSSGEEIVIIKTMIYVVEHAMDGFFFFYAKEI